MSYTELGTYICERFSLLISQWAHSLFLIQTSRNTLVTAELQKMYSDKGFSVLAFPISDFHQELGSNEEILSFVQENFPQVDFPIFGLSTLDESPVYQSIRKQKPEASVRWNFYKFLVDRHGQVVQVFDQKVNPLKLTNEIEDLLSKDSDRRRQKLVVS